MDSDVDLIKQHPLVEKARAVKEASDALWPHLPKRLRETFMAKVNLCVTPRQEAADKKAKSISTEHAAKGTFRSGATISGLWTAIDEEGQIAAKGIAEAAILLGCREDDPISRYIGVEFEFVAGQFIRSYIAAMGLSETEVVGVLGELEKQAHQRAVGFQSLVTSLRYDIEAKQGTFVERKIRWIIDRPAVGWAIVAYILVTSVVGTLELVQRVRKVTRTGVDAPSVYDTQSGSRPAP